VKLHIRLGWAAGIAGLPGLLLVRPFEPGRGEEGTAG